MKFAVFDTSNDAILYVSLTLVTINQLKSGLVDCEQRTYYPLHPLYNQLTKENIAANHLTMKRDNQKTQKRDLAVIPLSESAISPIYLERKRLAGLRGPVYERLNMICFMVSQACKPTVWESFENNIFESLRNSNPTDNKWDDGLLEYAMINGVEPMNAYNELKLQADNIQSIKMRIYGFAKYFSNKINMTTTEADMEKIKEEMEAKFYGDTRI